MKRLQEITKNKDGRTLINGEEVQPAADIAVETVEANSVYSKENGGEIYSYFRPVIANSEYSLSEDESKITFTFNLGGGLPLSTFGQPDMLYDGFSVFISVNEGNISLANFNEEQGPMLLELIITEYSQVAIKGYYQEIGQPRPCEFLHARSGYEFSSVVQDYAIENDTLTLTLSNSGLGTNDLTTEENITYGGRNHWPNVFIKVTNDANLATCLKKF